MLRHPGSSWGLSALLKSTSVVVLKVEESAGYSLPPPTIPAVPETRTRNLSITSLTLQPLDHDFPLMMLKIQLCRRRNKIRNNLL